MDAHGGHLHARRKKMSESVREHGLGATEQREIFKMLTAAGLQYTKNINGLFFNVTDIPPDLLARLENFISFVVENNANLDKYRLPPPVQAPPQPPDCAGPGPRAPDCGPGGGGGAGAPGEPCADDEDDMPAAAAANARSEALSIKRRDMCRFQQMKKKYSKPASRPNVTSVLEFDLP